MKKTMTAVYDTDLKNSLTNILKAEKIQKALKWVEVHLPEFIEIQKELTLIEAPTGHEKAKAERYKELLTEAGLEDVYMDEHFNVMGRIRGANPKGCCVVLEGHLDTVFSFGDVKEIKTDEKGRIHCPGICDDTRALSANLSVARAFKECGLVPLLDIYIGGTVREEGLGGMAGMGWMLDEISKKSKILASISIDGPTAEVFYANATGMTDWVATYEGPGGHAWTACNRPSAIHAAAQAISTIANLELPKEPKTTVTVSLVEGGQAIHGIAERASFKINARSNGQKELISLNKQLVAAMHLGAYLENAKPFCDGEITVTINKILDIPAGSQKSDSRIIQLAKLVTEAVGREPKFLPGGCTNTNMAIARKIPAITFGRGGEEYGTHTLKEWFNPKGVYACEQKSILMLALLAGVDGLQEALAHSL